MGTIEDGGVGGVIVVRLWLCGEEGAKNGCGCWGIEGSS